MKQQWIPVVKKFMRDNDGEYSPAEFEDTSFEFMCAAHEINKWVDMARTRSYRRWGQASQDWPSWARYASFLNIYVLPRYERMQKLKALQAYHKEISLIGDFIEVKHEH